MFTVVMFLLLMYPRLRVRYLNCSVVMLSCSRFQPRYGRPVDHDHYSNKRLLEIKGPVTRSEDVKHQREYRSRSPDRKRKGESRATVDSAQHRQSKQSSSNDGAAAARRREYVTDDEFKRKVHF